MNGDRGFSLVELMISSAITLAVAASVFGLLAPMHAAFAAEPERADMRQRLRVAADILYRDLVAATAVDPASVPDRPPVAPFRYGAGGDPPGTFRPDAVSVVLPGAPAAGHDIHAYFLEHDSAAAITRLRRARAGGANVPVVDHVVALSFEYFGGSAGLSAPLDPTQFTDGPWHPDSAAPDRYDVDLLGIRTVRVTLRVEAAIDSLRGAAGRLFVRAGTGHGARLVPDLETRFDVTVRSAVSQ